MPVMQFHFWVLSHSQLLSLISNLTALISLIPEIYNNWMYLDLQQAQWREQLKAWRLYGDTALTL